MQADLERVNYQTVTTGTPQMTSSILVKVLITLIFVALATACHDEHTPAKVYVDGVGEETLCLLRVVVDVRREDGL